MEQHNNHQRKSKTGKPVEPGRLMFFGAAAGVITGFLLLGNPTLGMGIGAVIGLIVGIAMNAPRKRAG